MDGVSEWKTDKYKCVSVFTLAEFCCSFVWIFCCYVTYYKETSYRVWIQKHLCSQILHGKDWCWSWNSNTLATWCEELTHLKRPWCWERLRAGGEGDNRGLDGRMALPTQWTWVWVNSGTWWWTGRPGVLQSMGSQRVRHDWATELNWTDALKYNKYRFNYSFK